MRLVGLEKQMQKWFIWEAILQFETPKYVDYNKETGACVIWFASED